MEKVAAYCTDRGRMLHPIAGLKPQVGIAWVLLRAPILDILSFVKNNY